MTLAEAKLAFANTIAQAVNESKLPPTVVRNVLADIDRAVAQLEEQQFQSALTAEEGEENNG